MKGKIDKGGSFQIERAGKWEQQICMFANRTNEMCCHRCPLFGEPEKKTITLSDPESYEYTLEICHGKILKLTELSDERKNK